MGVGGDDLDIHRVSAQPGSAPHTAVASGPLRIDTWVLALDAEIDIHKERARRHLHTGARAQTQCIGEWVFTL